MAMKHGKVVTQGEGLPPITSYNPLNCIYERSSDKLKTLYLPHHNAYGHKTYQCGDIRQGAPTYKFV